MAYLGAAMAPQGSTGKTGKYKASDKDYKLTGITISPADNGWVVECRHEPVRVKNGPDIPYREPVKYVYESTAQMLKEFPSLLAKKAGS